MSKLTDWATRHQLVSFFTLSFAISWGLLLSLGPLYSRGVVLVVPLLMLALFGPVLAGIILSGVIQPEPKQPARKNRQRAFLLTWLVATPVFVFSPELSRQGIGVSSELVLMAAVTALIPAFVVSSAFSRRPGTRTYLESLVKPRGKLVWYVASIFVVPALLVISIAITVLLGNEVPPPRVAADGALGGLLVIVLSAANRFFYANACGEEPGWRGFALPRLQALHSPLIANLILAFFWALWHLPLPQAQGLANPMAFLEYYIGTFCHCIIIAWLFNKTRGSILVAGLLHVSSNVSRLFIPETTAFQFTRPAFCLLLVVMYEMWRKLPTHSSTVVAPSTLSASGNE